MKTHILASLAYGAFSVVCPPPDQPPPVDNPPQVVIPDAGLPPCQGDVYLMHHWKFTPLDCDLTPPQTLVVRIDERQVDFDLCHQSGGQLMHDNEVPAWYCINLDY